jgi:cell division protein FtsA
MAKAREHHFIGLDIGTSKIVCIVGVKNLEAPLPSIIGLGESATIGLRRGSIVDVEETVSAITAAIEEAERMSGVAIDRATVSIDGTHVRMISSEGSVMVSKADHEITTEDVVRAGESATNLTLEANQQILDVIPAGYSVDDQTDISDPVGMHGNKLTVHAEILVNSTPAIKNIESAVFRSGISMNNRSLVGLAAARAVLSKRQQELGVGFIHIGAETTAVIVYEQGKLCHCVVLPVGSNHITKDLVYGLRTNADIAEKIKLKYGRAADGKKTNQTIDLESMGGNGVVSQSDLDMMIEARLDELVGLVYEELEKAAKKFTDEGGMAAGLVLSGGGAKLKGLDKYFESKLKLPTKVGRAEHFGSLSTQVADPMYASAIGLMLLDMESPQMIRSSSLSSLPKRIIESAKTVIKSLLP